VVQKFVEKVKEEWDETYAQTQARVKSIEEYGKGTLHLGLRNANLQAKANIRKAAKRRWWRRIDNTVTQFAKMYSLHCHFFSRAFIHSTFYVVFRLSLILIGLSERLDVYFLIRSFSNLIFSRRWKEVRKHAYNFWVDHGPAILIKISRPKQTIISISIEGVFRQFFFLYLMGLDREYGA
ncbi:hypothetical protein IFM89_000219, partial [Coptis chinensis]